MSFSHWLPFLRVLEDVPKHASLNVIDHLVSQDATLLPADQQQCPICYDSYTPRSVGHPLGIEPESVRFARPTEQFLPGDPDVCFPMSPSGALFSLYSKPGRGATRSASRSSESHDCVKMPGCNHLFGRSCLVEWLQTSVTCPLCRKEVEASHRSLDSYSTTTMMANCAGPHQWALDPEVVFPTGTQPYRDVAVFITRSQDPERSDAPERRGTPERRGGVFRTRLPSGARLPSGFHPYR